MYVTEKSLCQGKQQLWSYLDQVLLGESLSLILLWWACFARYCSYKRREKQAWIVFIGKCVVIVNMWCFLSLWNDVNLWTHLWSQCRFVLPIRLLLCCKNGRSTSWVLCGLFTQVGYKKRMWETTCKLENFLLLFLCPITCFQLFGCLVVFVFL